MRWVSLRLEIFNRHALPQRNNTMVRISPRPLYPTYKS